tara:strand:+ start:13109 stop:14062 length:954 start_codon:yes stop_codon:yes gene_type:complete
MSDLISLSNSIQNLKSLICDLNRTDKVDNLSLLTFEYCFDIVDGFNDNYFRNSIRNYRNNHGIENLDEELRLILTGAYYLNSFYVNNKKKIDEINIFSLEYNSLNFYRKMYHESQLELLPLKKEIREVSHEIGCLNYGPSSEKFKIKGLENHKDVLIYEQSFKIKAYEEAKLLYEQKSKDIRCSRFLEVNDICTSIINIVENYYLNKVVLFKTLLSSAFVDLFNEIFRSSLDESQIRNFLNNTGYSEVNPTKIKITYCLPFFYKVSNTILDEKIRNRWLNSMFKYFSIEWSYYEKKKKYQGASNLDERLENVINESL